MSATRLKCEDGVDVAAVIFQVEPTMPHNKQNAGRHFTAKQIVEVEDDCENPGMNAEQKAAV